MRVLPDLVQPEEQVKQVLMHFIQVRLFPDTSQNIFEKVLEERTGIEIFRVIECGFQT